MFYVFGMSKFECNYGAQIFILMHCYYPRMAIITATFIDNSGRREKKTYSNNMKIMVRGIGIEIRPSIVNKLRWSWLKFIWKGLNGFTRKVSVQTHYLLCIVFVSSVCLPNFSWFGFYKFHFTLEFYSSIKFYALQVSVLVNKFDLMLGFVSTNGRTRRGMQIFVRWQNEHFGRSIMRQYQTTGLTLEILVKNQTNSTRGLWLK